MNRLPLSILLEYEHTWPLAIGWIILHNDRSGKPGQNFFNKDAFVCQLIISMIRYLNLLTVN